MGEPNELSDQLGEVNLAGGFWKTWDAVEKKAPAENKDAQFVRVSAGFAGVGMLDGLSAFSSDVKFYRNRFDKFTLNI
eukprot:g29298.t1